MLTFNEIKKFNTDIISTFSNLKPILIDDSTKLMLIGKFVSILLL